jgi:exodeoxyribonuclease VII small subunit
MIDHPETLSFEDALTQLQEVVSKLESANLSLEETIDEFRRGTELAAFCQRLIGEAELKVTELVSAHS